MADPATPVADLAKSVLREQIGRILREAREASAESTGVPTSAGASPLPPQAEEEEIFNA